ncbi:PilW family protein [Natronospirillum operosum]|nr:PilW family protein [Natronospirillum operosum]
MPANRPWRQKGLSLLEVLVAMGLGLILIAGATNLFIGSSQTFRTNESLSRMQEEARFALNRMQRDVRSAGFQGCAPAVENRVATAGNELQNLLFTELPLLGWEHAGTGPGQTSTIDDYEVGDADNWTSSAGLALPDELAGAVVNGTDVLVVAKVERSAASYTSEVEAGDPAAQPVNPGHNIGQGGVALVTDGNCTSGNLARNTNNSENALTFSSSGNTANGLSFPTNPASEIFHYQIRAYYVGLSDDQPALFSQRLDGADGTAAIELVRGVESMQVLYGEAGSNNAVVAEAYRPADEVTDWQNVVSARVALLMRSEAPASAELNTRVFNLLGTEINPSGGTPADPDGDRFMRLQAAQTLGLRNRLR